MDKKIVNVGTSGHIDWGAVFFVAGCARDTGYKLTKIRDDKPFRTDFLGKKRKRK